MKILKNQHGTWLWDTTGPNLEIFSKQLVL